MQGRPSDGPGKGMVSRCYRQVYLGGIRSVVSGVRATVNRRFAGHRWGRHGHVRRRVGPDSPDSDSTFGARHSQGSPCVKCGAGRPFRTPDPLLELMAPFICSPSDKIHIINLGRRCPSSEGGMKFARQLASASRGTS